MADAEFIEKVKKGYKILDSIVDSWTGYEQREDGEYRFPATMKEIRRSRKKIRKFTILDPGMSYGSGLFERYSEIFTLIQMQEIKLRDFSGDILRKFVRSAAIALFAVLFFVVAGGDTEPKPYDFTPADWVTAAPTTLQVDHHAADHPDKSPVPGMSIPKGVQLTPLSAGAYRYETLAQVRTPDGFTGFVDTLDLAGGRRAVLRSDETLFSDGIAEGTTSALAKGDEVTILARETNKDNRFDIWYRVRLGDGRTGYVKSNMFAYPTTAGLPLLASFGFVTTGSRIEGNFVGHTLEEITPRYGPPLSVYKDARNRIHAYMPQIKMVGDGRVHSGLTLTLEDGVVTDYEFNGRKVNALYAHLPLVGALASFELSRSLQRDYYEADDGPGWLETKLENISNRHWSLMLLVVVAKIAVALGLCILVMALSRILLAPVMMLVALRRSLGNKQVLWINGFLLTVLYYAQLLTFSIMADSTFTGLLLSVPAYIFFIRRHAYYLNHNRCPHCHALETAVDTGTDYVGSTSVKYERFKDEFQYSSYDASSNTQTDHYKLKREEKTVTTLTFKDTLICGECQNSWYNIRIE